MPSHATAAPGFKLLAVKDEYEVARLFRKGEFERSLRALLENLSAESLAHAEKFSLV